MQTMYLEDGTAIIPIHYCVVEGDVERIACTPGLANLHSYGNKPVWQRTTDPRVVNCPLCRDTAAWKNEMAESAPLPRTPMYKMVPV